MLSRRASFVVLLLVVLSGCGNPAAEVTEKPKSKSWIQQAPPAQPQGRNSSTQTVGTTPAKPVDPPTSPPTSTNPEDLPQPKPEPLPAIPKADPQSVIKELNQEKTLLLETIPGGRKRILIVGEVCLREGILEVFLCRKMTKEHEAIARTEVDARFIHAALIAIGAKNGSPVQFVDPKSLEAAYKPASGQKIEVRVVYQREGKVHNHLANEWILDKKTKKPMSYEWVFAGSRFVKNPDRPDDPPYYTANNGEVIALSNFVDSMLDLPVEISRDAADLFFDAMTDKIPPLGTKFWIILEPIAEKK